MDCEIVGVKVNCRLKLCEAVDVGACIGVLLFCGKAWRI